ncbi:MAG: AI-2E family transporter, partial [Paracoccus sp. (in: a-proteobacteria)]
IPYLGAITGVIISTLVALIVMPDLFWPLMVGLTYLGLTSLEGQIITPYFVSRRLQMNTVVVFMAVALWAWLWSVIGMVIAVPVLVVIRVLAEHIPGWERLGNFLAGEDPPALEDDNEEEARDMVEAGAAAEDPQVARVVTARLLAEHDGEGPGARPDV